MELSNNVTSLSPTELRLLIRQNDPRIRTTSGLANGKKQWKVSLEPNNFCLNCIIQNHNFKISKFVHYVFGFSYIVNHTNTLRKCLKIDLTTSTHKVIKLLLIKLFDVTPEHSAMYDTNVSKNVELLCNNLHIQCAAVHHKVIGLTEIGLQEIFEAACDQALDQSLHTRVCTDKLQVD